MKKGTAARRKRRRLRILLAISATTFVIGAALLLMREADFHADPWLRGPASVLAPEELQDTPCRNLFEAVCVLSDLSNKDPTGDVHSDQQGENSAEEIREAFIERHPGWNSQQIDRAVSAEIYTPKRRARILNAFQQARLGIEQILLRQPRSVLSLKNQRDLLKRVRRVQLILPPPISIFQDDPDLLYRTDAVYERLRDGRLRIRIGGAYLLTARSWFNYIFTLAHEIAHSIDPCELDAAGIAPRAYVNIKHCLLRTGLVALNPKRQECQKEDQLSETFADWVATQVTAEVLGQFSTEFRGDPLLHAVANSVRDLCEFDSPTAPATQTDSHPSPQVRINGIFGRNSQIRALLACPPEPRQERECQWQESL